MIGIDPAQLSFRHHGAQLCKGAALAHLEDLQALLDGVCTEQAGVRINGNAALNEWLSPGGPVWPIVEGLIGHDARAVRAILFDKTPNTNWSLAWHQDRTICVKRRAAVDGYGPWTVKSGMHHVAPPFELLAKMVTARIHLDDVSRDNAPLLVALGSHRRGRISIEEIDDIVVQSEVLACLAEAGDVWLYSTPIIHASDAASSPRHRRVLQVDFSSDPLPDGLEWLGV